jgi:hypothetical protein
MLSDVVYLDKIVGVLEEWVSLFIFNLLYFSSARAIILEILKRMKYFDESNIYLWNIFFKYPI